MRNLFVLVVSVLLSLVLSATTQGGSEPDLYDFDGVADFNDNCYLVPNGPYGGVCAAQEDGDGDGFGNACDTDTNNNGQTDLSDVSNTLGAAALSSTDPTFDFNCNGQADLSDVSKALSDAGDSKLPGPACLRPSGTPCP